MVNDTAYVIIPDEVRDRVREALEEDSHDATKTLTERALAKDLAVRREVCWGDPAIAIVAYAVENDIDLIVMGTRGKTGFERYLLVVLQRKWYASHRFQYLQYILAIGMNSLRI